jgi:hypothetical protein
MATLSSSGPMAQAVFQLFAGSNAITPLPAGIAFTSWRCLMSTTDTLASPALATYAYLPSGENTAIIAPLPVSIVCTAFFPGTSMMVISPDPGLQTTAVFPSQEPFWSQRR